MNNLTGFILGCVFLLLLSNEVLACSCPHFVPGPDRARNEAMRADVIFVGKIIDNTPETATFKILQPLKGLENQDVIVSKKFTSCSDLYGPGYYIIYGSLEGKVLNTGYCSNNEKLEREDYHDAGAYDDVQFEKLLAGDIDRHNFHVRYLKKLLNPPTQTAKILTVAKRSDWYRNYTIYSSLKLVTLGFLISMGLLYVLKYRTIVIDLKRSVMRLAVVAGSVTLLSVMVYSELRPIGFETNLIQQQFGFPKYIYTSVIDTVNNSYDSSNFFYVNITANFFVYFVVFAVLLLTSKLIFGKSAA